MLEFMRLVRDALDEARIAWHESWMIAARASRCRHQDALTKLRESRSDDRVPRTETFEEAK